MNAFLAGSVLVTTGTTNVSGYSNQESGQSFGAIALGVDSFLSRGVSIEPFIEYRFNFSGTGSPGQTISFGISVANYVLAQ